MVVRVTSYQRNQKMLRKTSLRDRKRIFLFLTGMVLSSQTQMKAELPFKKNIFNKFEGYSISLCLVLFCSTNIKKAYDCSSLLFLINSSYVLTFGKSVRFTLAITFNANFRLHLLHENVNLGAKIDYRIFIEYSIMNILMVIF